MHIVADVAPDSSGLSELIVIAVAIIAVPLMLIGSKFWNQRRERSAEAASYQNSRSRRRAQSGDTGFVGDSSGGGHGDRDGDDSSDSNFDGGSDGGGGGGDGGGD